MKFFLVLFVALFATCQSLLNQCQKRQYDTLGSNSFVCVCNSTYCDQIDSVDSENPTSTYQEFVTSRSQYRLSKFKSPFDTTPSKTSQLNITVDRSKRFQEIIGFGGAMTDAAGYNIYNLSEKNVQNILDSYFGESGIEYGVIRVTIGGVDFSTHPYSYDDNANDFNLTKFSLTDEDFKWKIPFVQSALRLSNKQIKLFASAWTAPPWMKTNNDYKGNGTLIGPPGGLYYQTWANYYLKFFQSYKTFNLSFWGVTAQNEPTDGMIYKFSFNAMGFSPETQSEFIASNLGPTLENNGFGDIKIMILDDQRLFLPAWPQRVFDYSAKARKYVSGIAVHWYMDRFVPVKQLDLTHEAFPDKFIFGTEACIDPTQNILFPHVVLGSFDRAEAYAKYIIQDLNHWVTGWTDWNLALDLKGGPNWANNFVDAPIIVNATADEFYKQPMFYVMGHFSKFIPEGSVRINLTIESKMNMKKISHVAFVNDQLRQTILVLFNEGDSDFEYSIYDPEVNKYINSMSPAHSIKTIVWFF